MRRRLCLYRNRPLRELSGLGTEEQGKEIALSVDLGADHASSTVWTCDLSAEYVRINAEYRT
jgi:N-acetylglutamate synthase/N-acetylornithine aminotransferase